MSNKIIANITTRLRADNQADSAEFQGLIDAMKKTFGKGQLNSNGNHLWADSVGSVSLVIWLFPPERGKVRGRLEFASPLTLMQQDAEDDVSYVRTDFKGVKIGDFKKLVMQRLKELADDQRKDIEKDKETLRYLESLK